MATLAEIEASTKTYADARNALSTLVQSLEDELRDVKRKHLAGIKRSLNKTTSARNDLHALLDASPDLFVKPRTLVFHGVKIGFQKSKGKITWDDGDKVVKLIRKHCADQADVLIITKETPSKDTLGNLDAKTLKRLGVSVTEDADVVVIKGTDGEIDKLCEALLKDAEPETVSQARVA